MNQLPHKPSQSIAAAANSSNALEAFKGAMKAIIEESPEIVTGVAATVDSRLLVPIRLFHATAKGRFLRQLMAELEELRKKGKINDEFANSEQAWACLSDLMSFIDGVSPDPKRFEAIKNVFLNISMGDNRQSPMPQQILQIVASLSAGEILVLATASTMSEKADANVNRDWNWISRVSDASQLAADLIITHERALIEKGLLVGRTGIADVWRGNGTSVRNRITPLGMLVCKFMADSGASVKPSQHQ